MSDNGGASSISTFAERNQICPSSVYAEIRSGRLTAHKVGRRTLIFDNDERAWRESLPKFKTDQED